MTPIEEYANVYDMRKTIFSPGEIYHVYNRGVEKRPIFTNTREYKRAVITLDYYRFKNPPLRLAKALHLEKNIRHKFFTDLKSKGEKIVELISYCLMPNHFHFLLEEKRSGGIARYISNFSNSYTKYFNTKNGRVGPLLQGIFKAVRIEDDEQLLHVSRYIHLNPVVSFLIKDNLLEEYKWSSLPEYLGIEKDLKISETGLVLSKFRSPAVYRKFLYDQIDYAGKLEAIKHLILE